MIAELGTVFICAHHVDEIFRFLLALLLSRFRHTEDSGTNRPTYFLFWPKSFSRHVWRSAGVKRHSVVGVAASHIPLGSGSLRSTPDGGNSADVVTQSPCASAIS